MKSENEKKVLSRIKCLIEKNAPESFDLSKSKTTGILSGDYISTPPFWGRANFRLATVCIIIVFLLATTVAAFTTDVFKSNIFDIGVKKYASDGKANYDVVSSESNGITVEISGTVSDSNRTVFEMKVYGLNQNVNEPISLENIKLADEDGNNYQFHQCGADGEPVENVVINSLEFYGGPGKDTNLYLSFDGVDDINGNWNFKIPVKYFEEKIYETNIKYETDNEIWIINKISLYSSKTIIEGTIEKTKDWNFTMELKDGENIYTGFHGNVQEMQFPTSFKYDLEPMGIIDKDIKLYILNLDSNNRDDKDRAIIDIPVSLLEEA